MQLERTRVLDEQPAVRSQPLGPAPLPPPDFAEYVRQLDHQFKQQQHDPEPIQANRQRHAQLRDPFNGHTQELALYLQSSNSLDSATVDLVATNDLLASLTSAENTFIEVLYRLLKRNFEGATSTLETPLSDAANKPKSHFLAVQDRESHVLVNTTEILTLPSLLTELRHICRGVIKNTSAHTGTGTEMKEANAGLYDETASGQVQEIRDLIDQVVSCATPTEDASLARSLASMLGCLERLKTLYQTTPTLVASSCTTGYSALANEDSPSPSTALANPLDQITFQPAATVSTSPLAHADTKSSPSLGEATSNTEDVYQALHRQARALQSTRSARTDSTDPATLRAVEEAEVELLWGRLDDILETVLQPAKNAALTDPRPYRLGVDYMLVGPTPGMTTDDATFPSQHSLPEYSTYDPPEYAVGDYQTEGVDVDEKDTSFASERSVRSTGTNGSLRLRASDEKMQIDLDRMTSAIERLYIASPQFANQRVDTVRASSVDRSQIRERQLANLGAAIERLNKGRLEDQRAVLGIGPLELPSDNQSGKSERIFGKGKSAETKQKGLDKLLESIDKASSRSMDDQRVTISARHRAVLTGARTTAQAAATDLKRLQQDEAAFREHLVDSTRKGRLTSQDAAFHDYASATASSTTFQHLLQYKRRSLAHIFDTDPGFGESSQSSRARSNSVGAVSPLPPIPHYQQRTESSTSNGSHSIRKRFSIPRLLSSNGSRDSFSFSAPMSRKGSRTSPNGSPAPSLYSEGQSHSANSEKRGLKFDFAVPLHVTYVVEEMKNLSSMIVRAWDSRFEDENNTSSSGLVQEAWCVHQYSTTSLHLSTSGATYSREREPPLIRLVGESSPIASPSKPLDMIFKKDHYELRLPTAESARSTRARNDLEIAMPYSAQDFRDHPTTKSFICVSCGAQLLDLTHVTKFNDLPSEHWAELLDAWMCHHDQNLSDELIAKGNNIWPKHHQALISSSGILVSAPNARSWIIAKDLEPTHSAEGKWCSVRCASCQALIGRSPEGILPNADPSTSYVKFAKYAVRPALVGTMPPHHLSSHITSHLLETSLARAVHRFLVQDEEDSTTRIVLWVFNPFIRIFSNSASFASTEPVNAVKIFYHSGADLDDALIDQLLGAAEHETVTYPSRICSQLTDLLETSTQIYPKSQQKLGDWTVGWLERAF